ncbi:MAG: magnesium transporter [Candidatus Diapherotrites archaeon]
MDLGNIGPDGKKYHKDSAGANMSTALPVVGLHDSIGGIRKMLSEKIASFDTISYIYVVDGEKRLAGLFSIKEVFRAKETSKASEIMRTDIVTARPHTDQEEVAILALTKDMKNIPVVDKNGVFLGTVRSRTILNILNSEHVEDFLKLAGIHSIPSKALHASPGHLVKARMPWLLLGLLGGIAAAQVTTFFEAPLKEYFVLAAFMPLIVYMADAIGTQTETLFIRNLAMQKFSLKEYFFREAKVGTAIASILGAMLFVVALALNNLPRIAIILGISMFVTGLIAVFVPIIIVVAFQKMKKDPAMGSGPFATVLQDIISLAVYFTIASVMLKVI